jgi:hypothetical protein
VDVTRRGWEARANLRLPALRTAFSGSVTRTAVEYRGPVLEGQVVYRPAITASAGLSSVISAFELDASLRHVGERRTVAGSSLNALDPYTVVGFGDEQAEYLVDFPSAGRLWSVGVELTPRGLQP